MKVYIGKGWEQTLQFNNLADFDSIWNLEAGWFEEPNERRGGWSGVSKIDLKMENGESVGIFLKRQENHDTKSVMHPFKGEPTFYREFKNIQRFINHDIPTVEPVYFYYRYQNGKSQAILMTKALDGFDSLDADIYARDGLLMRDRLKREGMMKVVAREMRKMHEQRFRHNCFYSKHIFVRELENDWEVRFIDLEKLCRSFFVKNAMIRDLYTLPRRISGWGTRDELKFLQIYRQEDKLLDDSKLIWRQIANKIKAKHIRYSSNSK